MFSGMRQPTQRSIGAPWLAAKLAAASLGLAASVAAAQPDPSGIDFVTIGAPNNPAYQGLDPQGYVTGRGSVPYEFRIGRTEVTTGQWLEFYNAALARPDALPWIQTPVFWGAQQDATHTGPGRRYVLRAVADAAMLPTGGVDWRTSAMFCNWLHNGKSADRAAFLSGAYDVSTFGYSSPGIFTDQPQHSPDARYWIPTLDQWLKAVHWDPNRSADGGWWQYANMSDVPLTYGPPPSFGGSPLNQANAGFTLPNFGELLIPLGAYPNALSPWGLLDAAGATREWTEEIRRVDQTMLRVMDGSARSTGPFGIDVVWSNGGIGPESALQWHGLRISAVPPPNSLAAIGIALVFSSVRRQREGRSSTNIASSSRHSP